MFKTTIINTFSSEDECEMFIMVLKQQWPKYKDSVPESTLEIVKDIDMPNRMLALWSFKQKADQKVIMKIGEQIIIPFRDRLAPKTIRDRNLEVLMNKWNTIKSLIENKDFEGLQDILHDEYLYLRETTLISKDDMVSFIKKRFEDGLTFEKLELIIENKDLLAWRDVLIEHGGKKWETTNVQLWKDNKVWRDVVSVRDLEKVDRI